MRRILLLLAALVASAFATAHDDPMTTFEHYNGVEATFTGSGGKSPDIVDGVEIWKKGTPARKFRVLGVLVVVRDVRGPRSPDRIDKAELAGSVRAAGGDALIYEAEGLAFKSEQPSLDIGLTIRHQTGHVYRQRNDQRTRRMLVIKFADKPI